ncbi:MAG: TIGR02301 family protein [Pararhizobium sp.]
MIASPLSRAAAGLFLLLLPALAQAADSPHASSDAAQTTGDPSKGSDETTPPIRPKPLYEAQLTRLSQVLGSIDYLRQLCHSGDGADWRDKMKAILDAEAGSEPERIKRLTAAFNRGYRSFASVYTGCTASAVLAEQQYRREGATLAREIAAKYGN